MAANPYLGNVVLQLACDGADASTAFTDDSPSGHTVTAWGSAQVSTSGPKYGSGSLLLDGSGDYLTAPSSADWGFGTGDFTVELWLKTTQDLQYATILSRESGGGSFSTGAWTLMMNHASSSAGDVAVYVAEYNTGAPLLLTSGVDVGDGSWHHIAWVRSGSSHYLFVDGVQRASNTAAFSIGSNGQPLCIGNDLDFSPRALAANVDDVRIHKGLAVYTSGFTPPTEAHSPARAGWAEVPGPLGAPAVFGAALVSGLAEIPTPLGSPAALSLLAFGWAADTGPLGAPAVVGHSLWARVAVDGPLTSSQVSVLAFHDFTGQLGDTVTRYVMYLTTPGGSVRMRISSWQATLRSGAGSGYAQCVVPAVQGLVETIQDATEFTIYRTAVLPSGGTIEYEMVRCPLEQLSLDQGSARHTATLAGYFDALPSDGPTPSTDRTLTEVRSVSITDGGARVRCAIDWLLRPGQTALHADLALEVTFINYYGTDSDQYMDVGSYSG